MSRIQLDSIPACYRPVPFWSWNDKLDPEELRRQIQAMHQQGIGGFFMHARGGLQTAYLSPEWMDCVNACCDEAGKLGMEAWLYDENGWPSGFGGGLVNGLGEHFQQKYLRFEQVEADQGRRREHTIAFYTQDGTAFLGRELPQETTGTVLRAFYEVNPYYVDNLDASVVREFLRVTHQYYYEHIPADLLAHMKGIFTDEPQLSRNGLVWSLVLEQAYREEYDRDLLEELPRLAYDLPSAGGTRVRFWRLCASLFRDHFAKQVREWCDAHGWALTGHYVLEETCESQLSSNGAIMPQYQYLSIPGMDHLGRSLPAATAMTQVASVAAQVGQKQILTESFALTGWNCNFTGQRYIYQPQLAHGINLLCQHLQGYSLRGLRKRDYPSSNFYHQPWWKDYRIINDHFSRIGQILAEGTQQVRVLVLHPQSSAWMKYTGLDDAENIHYYSEHLARLTEELDARQIPHHYADEVLAESLGSSEHGLIALGKCTYDTVVIPVLCNLSSKIHEMLRVFQLSGGTIFRLANHELGRSQFSLDGEPADNDSASWFLSLPMFEDEAQAADAIAGRFPQRVRLQEQGMECREMLSTSRHVEDLEGQAGTAFLVVNRRYDQGAMVRVSLPALGAQVEVLKEDDGKLELLDGVQRHDGRFVFDYYFGAADSALFFLPETVRTLPVADTTRQLMLTPGQLKLPTDMILAKATENLLTLDRCRYRIDGGDWQTADIISLQSRLVILKRDVDVELEIPFFVGHDFDLSIPLTLVVETPGLFSFALNGSPFQAEDQGFLFDRAFRRIPLPPTLQPGCNTLSLSLRYHQPQALYDSLEAAKKFETEYNKLTFETELESVYLAGDFGVRHLGERELLDRDAVRFNGTFELCPSPLGKQVDARDLLGSGLPFFAGRAELECVFNLDARQAATLRCLRFVPHGANSWSAWLNGDALGTRFWGPYGLSVQEKLHEGENRLRLQLTTSLRNLLGPHHLAEGECYAVLTTSFNTEENFVGTEAPATVPGYCMVQLGLEELELL